jgi:SAM-dependent methyltransferase
MADDETHLFRTSWSLYDALAAENYMFHREIYTRIAELLRQRRESGPYELLDLGCGNARFLAPCLRAAAPVSYEGVDLSQAALDEARGYLDGLEKVSLHCQDMLQAVCAAPNTFDTIFSGYAVHHLDAVEKQQLFHACAARLNPGGVFILVDVVREEGQSRADYLDGYLRMMRTQWVKVRPEDMEAACAHVAAYDFPETVSDLARMAAAAGLREPAVVERFGPHHVIIFHR